MVGKLIVSKKNVSVKNSSQKKVVNVINIISPVGLSNTTDEEVFVEDTSTTIDTLKHTWHVFNGTKSFIEGLNIHENGWVSDTHNAYFVYDFGVRRTLNSFTLWTIYIDDIKLYLSNDPHVFTDDDLAFQNNGSIYGLEQFTGYINHRLMKSNGRYIKVEISCASFPQVSIQELEFHGN